jgi:hypothetical protein
MVRENDREKFVNLAHARVNRTLKCIQLIGNLSNRSNYDYTDEDITKIFRALNDEVAICRKRFDTKKKSGNDKFTLE